MTRAEAEWLFPFLHSFWPKGSVFRYFARRPSDNTVFGCAIGSAAELARITDWADHEGYNSYWQINATRKLHDTRCSTIDITHWCWFPLDIDPTTPEPALSAYLADIDRYWPLSNHGRLLLDSGRGLQVLYPLATPVPLQDADQRWEVPQILRHHLHDIQDRLSTNFGCVIDTSCTDLPRVMRLPFTLNQKMHRRAYVLATPGSDKRLTAEALLASVTFSKPQPTPIPTDRAHWMGYLGDMTVAARRFIFEGAAEPGRHRAAASAMLSMIEAGASQEQICEALYRGAAACSPPLPRSEIDDMVRRRFRRNA